MVKLTRIIVMKRKVTRMVVRMKVTVITIVVARKLIVKQVMKPMRVNYLMVMTMSFEPFK